jgi:hypothetical protein
MESAFDAIANAALDAPAHESDEDSHHRIPSGRSEDMRIRLERGFSTDEASSILGPFEVMAVFCGIGEARHDWRVDIAEKVRDASERRESATRSRNR